MRPLLACIALTACLRAAPKDDVIAAVQRTFDAMAARDAAAIRAAMLPEAQLYIVSNDGKTRAVPLDAFAKSIGEAKEPLLERMWKPRVLIHGRLATLWTQYDFHRGGKFHHCGVDAIHLLHTPEGWKVASIAYTTQTQGCKPSPLGPPKP